MFKNKRKKIVSLALAVVIAATSSVAVLANRYTDTVDHWAKGTIEKWSDYKVVQGADSKYRPNDPVKMSEFSAILNRVMGYQEVAKNTFTDMSDANWYFEDILKLKAAGILDDTKEINAERNLTREEVAVMAARVYDVARKDGSTTFADDLNISTNARPAVKALTGLGILNGKGNNMFDPKANVTRAEVLAIMDRLSPTIVFDKGEQKELNVSGNMVINTKDVKLTDSKISGNLYLAEGIGNGDASLKNVKVGGTLYIKGGGPNTITLDGVEANNVIVDKADGNVRVLVLGDSPINGYVAKSGVIIDNKDNKSTTLPDVKITSEVGTQTVTLNGKFDVLTNEDKEAVIKTDASFKEVVATAKTAITGTATIDKVSGDSAVTVNDKTVTNTTSGTGTTTSSGSTSGGGSNPEQPVDPGPVVKPAATSVLLNYPALSVVEGGTLTPTLTLTPSNADPKATYTSSAPTVATVDASGKVTAVSAGTVNITVTMTKGGASNTSPVITVTAPALASIAITTPPTTTTYLKGTNATATPNTDGMVVTGTFDNGTSRTLLASEYSVGTFDDMAAATVQVTVTSVAPLAVKTATFDVTVKEPDTAVATDKYQGTYQFVKADGSLLPSSAVFAFDDNGVTVANIQAKLPVSVLIDVIAVDGTTKKQVAVSTAPTDWTTDSAYDPAKPEEQTFTAKATGKIASLSPAPDLNLNTDEFVANVTIPVKQIKITYDLNGGNIAGNTTNPEETFDYDVAGFAVKTDIPTKVGNTFTKWSGSDGKEYHPTDTTTPLLQTIKVTADATLTAQYTPKTFKVTYDANGGAFTDTAGDNIKNVTFTGSALPLETTMNNSAFSRDGYRFDGWTDTATGTTAITDIPATVEADTTVYALWVKQAAFTYNAVVGGTAPVAFGDDDIAVISNNTADFATEAYDVGATFPTLATPMHVETTNVFLGWFTDEACTTALVVPEEVEDQAYVLYAKFVSQAQANVDAAIAAFETSLDTTAATDVIFKLNPITKTDDKFTSATVYYGPLALPASHDGVTIAWASNDTDVIADNGTVTRDASADKTVVLTGTFTQGDATGTTTISVTVKKASADETEQATELASLITWDMIKGNNTFPTLTGDLDFTKIDELITDIDYDDVSYTVVPENTFADGARIADNGAVLFSSAQTVKFKIKVTVRFREASSRDFVVNLTKGDSFDALTTYLDGIIAEEFVTGTDTPSAVTDDLDLTTYFGDNAVPSGSLESWKTSKAAIITDAGVLGGTKGEVTLTLVLTDVTNSTIATKELTFTVV